jgi:hypothetical protein
MNPTDAMARLLEEEAGLLIRGELGTLGDLADRKRALLDRIEKSPQPGAGLAPLARMANRNQRLFGAALAAVAQVAAIRNTVGPAAFTGYGADGRRWDAAQPPAVALRK